MGNHDIAFNFSSLDLENVNTRWSIRQTENQSASELLIQILQMKMTNYLNAVLKRTQIGFTWNMNLIASVKEKVVAYASDYTFLDSFKFQTSIDNETQSMCGNSSEHSTYATLCETSLVLVESEMDSSCPPQEPFEDLYPGYIFPKSPPGTREFECPETSTGNATWECGTNGNWIGSPDLQ